MKRRRLLCILTLACLVQMTFAQSQSKYFSETHVLPMPFPDKLVKPASDNIIPAHIPEIKKPFIVSAQNNIDRVRDFINTAPARCSLQKKPQETIELNAERINNLGADLKWETKYAFKAFGFNIERSLADTFHFRTINFASAATGGGIKKNYQLPDPNDYAGISFYRIRQENSDATFAYSNIVSVEGFEVRALKIYPNPALKNLTVEFRAQQSGNITINVFDLSGKIVQHNSLDCIKNSVVQKNLDVTAMMPGSYQVKIVMPDKTFLTGRFIKQ